MEPDYMGIAVELSEKNVAEKMGGPFGCVVVQNNRIVATGSNSVTRLNDPTAHAEVMAVRNACQALNTFNLAGCELYTSCEPCPMCYAAIRWARIDRIYYANTRLDADRIGFSDNDIYDEIISGRMKTTKIYYPSAQKAFDMWIDMTGNIRY